MKKLINLSVILVILAFIMVFPLQAQEIAPRERLKTIQNYIVYYGLGRASELARYDLAIVQPETLTPEALAQLKAEGTLVVAYLSLGEVEPYRPWYSDGRFDPAWSLGQNANWGSYFVDANQPGWQALMVSIAGEYLAYGYDGIFLDTVDTAVAFPQTEPGMIALIQGLRQAYPNALLIQNRGFGIAEKVSADLDAVMFESLSTGYDFANQDYLVAQNPTQAQFMVDLRTRTGLVVLALDYAAPQSWMAANLAIFNARRYGFIPAVSVILLNDLPSYQIDFP